MKIAVDRQHVGRRERPADRGAQSPQGWSEVWATGVLALALEEELVRLGHQVLPICSGTYAERHAWVNGSAVDLYIACHFNAGIGDRAGEHGLVFHWPGSERGAAFARSVAAASQKVTPWGVRAVAAEPGTWDNVRACMASARPPALVLELGFVDGQAGRTWLAVRDNLERLGRAVAAGVA